MAQEHLQGQDVEIRIARDGRLIAALSSVRSLEFSQQTEAVLFEFLGQRSPKVEMTYGGVEGSIELNHKDSAFWTLLASIQDVAQHRTPGIEFSIGCTVRYPSGQRVRLLIRDLGFDAQTVSISGQREAVSSRLPWKASKIARITGAAAL